MESRQANSKKNKEKKVKVKTETSETVTKVLTAYYCVFDNEINVFVNFLGKINNE